MIVSLIVKAIFYYIIFIVIKGAWNAYRSYKFIKHSANEAFKQHGQGGFDDFSSNSGQAQRKTSSQSGDVEAEYRVVDK